MKGEAPELQDFPQDARVASEVLMADAEAARYVFDASHIGDVESELLV